jgi:hypothetical protein
VTSYSAKQNSSETKSKCQIIIKEPETLTNHLLDFSLLHNTPDMYQQSRLSELRALTCTGDSDYLRNRSVAETCPVLNPYNRIKHSKYISVRNACDLLIYPRGVSSGRDDGLF